MGVSGVAYDLANAIRGFGVPVVEVAGWQDRGHGPLNDAVCPVFHHTAGGYAGTAPSLNVCIYGTSYTAPGPLCNVLQSREDGEGNDKAYVISGSTSYNAGYGGFKGVSGNSRTLGLEIEHPGTFRLADHRRRTAWKIAAAFALVMGESDGQMACQHFEWSGWGDGSKIDVATEVNADEWRDQVTAVLQGGGSAPPTSAQRHGSEDMVIKEIDANRAAVGWWLLSGAGITRLDHANVSGIAYEMYLGGVPVVSLPRITIDALAQNIAKTRESPTGMYDF